MSGTPVISSTGFAGAVVVDTTATQNFEYIDEGQTSADDLGYELSDNSSSTFANTTTRPVVPTAWQALSDAADKMASSLEDGFLADVFRNSAMVFAAAPVSLPIAPLLLAAGKKAEDVLPLGRFSPFFGVSKVPVKVTAEDVKGLAGHVWDAITHLDAIRSHGVKVDYATDVLYALYHELQDLHANIMGDESETAVKVAVLQQVLPPAGDAEEAEIKPDAISLYASSEVMEPEAFFNHFLQALVTSPMVEEADFAIDNFRDDPTFALLARHAIALANDGVTQLMNDYIDLFPKDENRLERIIPYTVSPQKELGEKGLVTAMKEAYAVRPRVWDWDPYAGGRVEGELQEVKPLSQYYGYAKIKIRLGRHFQTFAEGKVVKPLLLEGVHGVGKTHLPIAYAKEHPNLQVVKVSKELLPEKFKDVLESLRNLPGRFVVIIDDVGQKKDIGEQLGRFTDVYEGAGRAAPENVLLVMSSNQAFPKSVVSRSMHVEFPDIKQPTKQNLEVVAAMIGDFIGQQKDAGVGDDLDIFTMLIIHDYMGGRIETRVTDLLHERPAPHGFGFSPRGLGQYLDDLKVSGRWKTVKDRVPRYKEAKAAADERAAEIQSASEEALKAKGELPGMMEAALDARHAGDEQKEDVDPQGVLEELGVRFVEDSGAPEEGLTRSKDTMDDTI